MVPAVSGVGRVARAVAFWSAVVLPAAVVAALVLGRSPPAVATLLLANAVALVAGHGHRSETGAGRADA